MYRDNRIPKLSDSKIYNFLKYNNFDETLDLYNFKKVSETNDNRYSETIIKFESDFDEFICKLSLIGKISNILDASDNDFIARLAGYSDEKQFVPHLISFEIESFVTKKIVVEESNQFSYSYNRPEKYRLCINLYIDELINNSNESYIRFVDLLKDNVLKLYKEFETKFPKEEYHYKTNDKILLDFNYRGKFYG